MNQNMSCCIWFTGLSGAGKTTLANALNAKLLSEGKQTSLLDGDVLRKGLNSDLGFSEQDRRENIRRVAEVSKLMVDAGIIVIAALISPFQQDRETARTLIGPDRFMEVYVNTPIEICEERDIKGLYRRARAGEIAEMTGISSPYEIPQHPDFIANNTLSIEVLADELFKAVLNRLASA
jgi:bifunctional enzyme CysN/CysC